MFWENNATLFSRPPALLLGILYAVTRAKPCRLTSNATQTLRAKTIFHPATGGRAKSGSRRPFRRGNSRGPPAGRATSRFRSAPVPNFAQCVAPGRHSGTLAAARWARPTWPRAVAAATIIATDAAATRGATPSTHGDAAGAPPAGRNVRTVPAALWAVAAPPLSDWRPSRLLTALRAWRNVVRTLRVRTRRVVGGPSVCPHTECADYIEQHRLPGWFQRRRERGST